MRAGDVFECIDGDKLRIVSAAGFNLENDGDKAEYILIDERGEMEGYSGSLEQIEREYHIVKVVESND